MSAHQFVAIPRYFSAIVPCFALIFAANCSKSESELVGFHKYEIGKTTKKDGIACSDQGEQTYCSHNDSPSIAGHKTQTDLYFNGHGEDAPLVEILVGIWKCDPGQVSTSLYAQMGEPKEKIGSRMHWAFKHMTVIANLENDKGLCTMHFLDHGEKARIAKLFPRPSPAPTTAPAK